MSNFHSMLDSSTDDFSFKLEDYLFTAKKSTDFRNEFELPLPLVPDAESFNNSSLSSSIAQIRFKGRKLAAPKEEVKLHLPRFRPEMKQIVQLLKDFKFSPLSEKPTKGTKFQ